ncbi:hypothetical protein ABZ897_38215 [Nonomuraea sp. NPDC046802]|uniref:hypothetical protein n=1 Tax=Nonomuraea sp. NPDC046802 TaxID=3154919 RepID=UPI0033D5A9A7
MWRKSLLALSTFALAIGATTATPAQAAAYPTSTFYTSYGNNVVKGKITWYNKSAYIEGTIKSASECRWAYVEFRNGRDSVGRWFYPACGGDSRSFSDKFDTPYAGGFTHAKVWIGNEVDGVRWNGDQCRRTSSTCWDL